MRGRVQLLERSEELAALAAHLDSVQRTASGRVCLIGGEAGVGKTALVREFTREHAGPRIRSGACDPLFTPRPLGPLVDIAAPGSDLARLVATTARPYEVAAALVDELRRSPPTVVVLEDLHWADEATLDVVRLLSRRIEAIPAFLILTYRDDELGRSHPLRSLLGELPRQDTVRRLKVHPLSAGAVATLARSHHVDADHLYRRTGGNPFFVTEALASGEDEIPLTVRDAVLARAARLGAPARSLLDVVAIMPALAELWLLEAVSPDHFAALGECLASGMLTTQDHAVVFRHELARLAIEESIAPDRALELHRRALRHLADPRRGTSDPARLAHHAEAAHDADALLRYAVAAGDRASALGAHREAAAQFERARGVASGLPARQRAEILEKLAQERLLADDAERAIVAEEEALDLYRRAGDVVAEAEALRRLSRLYICGGEGARAEAPIVRAVELLEPHTPGRELALAYSGLASLYMNRDDAEGTARASRRAIELAEQVGDTETLLHTLNSLGSLEVVMGEPGGQEKVLRSLELAEQSGMDEHVGRAYINLGDALGRARRYDGLQEFLARGIDYCLEHGLDLWRIWLLDFRARTYLERGDWSQAVETAELVLRTEGTEFPRVIALWIRALVRARRGDPEVWPLLDEATAIADREAELQFAVPVAVARAEARWLEGRREAIADETERWFRAGVERGAWWQIGELAVWRWRAGIRDDLPTRLPERYRAEIAGEWSRAAELWTDLGCEYEAALALAGAEDDEALRRSLTALQRLGARATAAAVARRLRERGARGIARGPRPSTQRNPALLTERELEVLALVHAGMRNAEIAERLFLTPKTVDHHVSAILRKLSVTSRLQAAREAARLGLLD